MEQVLFYLFLDHIIFGIDDGSRLHLRPSAVGDRHRAAVVRPMSRKDIFYSGSVLNLAAGMDGHGGRRRRSSGASNNRRESDASSTAAQAPTMSLKQYRHSVISVPRYVI